jgi:predicted phosphodiesterase
LARKSARRAERVLILPDAHFPHHDHGAMGCVLHVAEHWKPDRIVILGDWLDCGAFSRHPGLSPEETRVSFLRDEIAPCNAVLDDLQKHSRQLVYLEGNHEQRVERHAATLMPAQGEDLMALASPEALLRRRVGPTGEPGKPRKRFTYIPYLGKAEHAFYRVTPDLIAVHGWSHGRHAAAVHLAKARSVSVVFGHVHRQQMECGRDPLTGRHLYSWSPGCLSKLVPLYQASSPNDWLHGFSMVFVGQRSWTPYNVTIHPDGWCVLPDGTEIRG